MWDLDHWKQELSEVAHLILENEDLKRQLGINIEKKATVKSQKENKKCDVLDLMKKKRKYHTGFDNERNGIVRNFFIPDPNDPPLHYSKRQMLLSACHLMISY